MLRVKNKRQSFCLRDPKSQIYQQNRGEVITGKLIVESGATFNASCSMNKDGKKSEIQLVSEIEETREKTA